MNIEASVGDDCNIVAVGLSGGVDSSVAAWLLQQSGHKLVGMFMKNWEDDSGACNAALDAEDAASVAEQIGIQLIQVNLSKQYWDKVFQRFIEEYKAGYTPNPDLLCNREIKFCAMFKKARNLGASVIATGHYARIVWRDGQAYLARAVDDTKDQSYFLAAISREVLPYVKFPLGEMRKSQVRSLAASLNFKTATKRDSTGICFIGKRDFRPFLAQFIDKEPGPMITPEGRIVGTHDGLSFYTIGQRKGLGIGGEGEAWYVVDKRQNSKELVVVQGEEHPALFRQELVATEENWLADVAFPLRCTAKVRYRQEDQPCWVYRISDTLLRVEFDSPLRAVTPRQAIVFYQDEICLGCAWIQPW